MAYVVLDIGAGSLKFARALRWKNFSKRLQVFAGEPDWAAVSLVCDTITPEDALWRIEKDKTGCRRVRSTYRKFAFPDESLDMVTLNAANPLTPPVGVGAELNRCLKRGGLFFWSYPLKLGAISFSDNFRRVLYGDWPKNSRALRFDPALLPDAAPSKFPASRTMESSLYVQRKIAQGPEAFDALFSLSHPKSSYLYSATGVAPGYELWIKE